jgi:hypothetical protein
MATNQPHRNLERRYHDNKHCTRRPPKGPGDAAPLKNPQPPCEEGTLREALNAKPSGRSPSNTRHTLSYKMHAPSVNIAGAPWQKEHCSLWIAVLRSIPQTAYAVRGIIPTHALLAWDVIWQRLHLLSPCRFSGHWTQHALVCTRHAMLLR